MMVSIVEDRGTNVTYGRWRVEQVLDVVLVYNTCIFMTILGIWNIYIMTIL